MRGTAAHPEVITLDLPITVWVIRKLQSNTLVSTQRVEGTLQMSPAVRLGYPTITRGSIACGDV